MKFNVHRVESEIRAVPDLLSGRIFRNAAGSFYHHMVPEM
jgi:hypothetical protein